MSTEWSIPEPDKPDKSRLTALEIEDYEQDIQLRKGLVAKVWLLCVVSSGFIGCLALIKGFCPIFALSDTVFVAMITGVVTESLGILAIVARYLFPQYKKPTRS